MCVPLNIICIVCSLQVAFDILYLPFYFLLAASL